MVRGRFTGSLRSDDEYSEPRSRRPRTEKSG